MVLSPPFLLVHRTAGAIEEACMVEPTPDIAERFERGVREFNSGDFYASHDTWEDVWMDVRGPERPFFQGMIQVAVGYYHLTCENYPGAEHLLTRGIRKLEAFRSGHRGLDTGGAGPRGGGGPGGGPRDSGGQAEDVLFGDCTEDSTRLILWLRTETKTARYTTPSGSAQPPGLYPPTPAPYPVSSRRPEAIPPFPCPTWPSRSQAPPGRSQATDPRTIEYARADWQHRRRPVEKLESAGPTSSTHVILDALLYLPIG